jgi:N-acetylneuraminate synthase
MRRRFSRSPPDMRELGSTAMRTFVIAEAGLLHDGSLGNAIRLAEAAAEAGADAVKYQLHDPPAEMIRSAPAPSHFTAESRWDYFSRTAFSDDEWAALSRACEAAGIEFMCSVFSVEALERVESLGVKRHKIPSGEVTNLGLVRRAAETGRPVLLSSGMSSLDELDAAVAVVRDTGSELTILQCTSKYPCPPERVGLNLIADLRDRHRVPVGFSDHTVGPNAALAAVTLGATVIEKHFTLSRRMYGSDAPFAAEPDDLRGLVAGIREIETILGNPVDKDDLSSLTEVKDVFEKSVVTLTSIPAGSVVSAAALAVKKPGTGVPAARLSEVVGRRALRDLVADAVVTDDDIDWDS